jgi:hypothetical protein
MKQVLGRLQREIEGEERKISEAAQNKELFFEQLANFEKENVELKAQKEAAER